MALTAGSYHSYESSFRLFRKSELIKVNPLLLRETEGQTIINLTRLVNSLPVFPNLSRKDLSLDFILTCCVSLLVPFSDIWSHFSILQILLGTQLCMSKCSLSVDIFYHKALKQMIHRNDLKIVDFEGATTSFPASPHPVLTQTQSKRTHIWPRTGPFIDPFFEIPFWSL